MATDTLEIFGTEYSGVTGIKATDSNNQTKTYIRPQGTVTLSTLGNTDVTDYATATVADANCIASNIKKDVSIMGVTGTYEGGGGGSYPWFGAGTTFVERKLNKSINLKNDTTFDSWTASTTSGDIKAASSTNDFSVTADYNNTYWIVVRYYTEYAYLSGVTLKNIPKRNVAYHILPCFPYPSDNNSLIGGTNNGDTYMSTFGLRGGLRYYGSTTGTLAYYGSYSYGVFPNNAPTVSTSSLTYSFKLTKFQARCNSTYFATSRKPYIDSANTNIIVTADVYKTPCPNSYFSWVYENLRTDLTSGL